MTLCSAENNYLVLHGHMSEQTQFWSDAKIIWSDVVCNSCEHAHYQFKTV